MLSVLYVPGRLLSRLRRRGGQSELCLRQVFPPARRHFLLLGVPGAPRNRQQDIAQAREIGLEAYLTRLEEKRAILDALLAGYNDGRRKTLFNTAVYLLPLEALQSVMAVLAGRPELEVQPIKERTLAAVELLQEVADGRGISLKLNKKLKKG